MRLERRVYDDPARTPWVSLRVWIVIRLLSHGTLEVWSIVSSLKQAFWLEKVVES